MSDRILPFILKSTDNGIMAETAITLGDQVLGYVGASRYVETTENDAIDILAGAIKELLDKDPNISQRSRFGYEED